MNRILPLIFLSLILGTSQGLSQSADSHHHPGKGKKDHPSPQEKPRKEAGAKPQKDHNPEGNAFGTRKDTLKGKEFGQNRAEQARLIRPVKKQDLAKARQKSAELKEKVKKTREKLSSDRKAGRITDAEAKAREDKLKSAQTEIDKLDKTISESAPSAE